MSDLIYPAKLFAAIDAAMEILKEHIAILRAIEETREPQPEKKVPMPLKRDELRPLDLATGIVLGVDDLKARGLGIYRISEVEEACR